MMISDLIANLRGQDTAALERRAEHTIALSELRALEVKGEDVDLGAVENLRALKAACDAEISERAKRIEALEAEQRADEAATVLAAQSTPTGTRGPAYDRVVRVGVEERTYHVGNCRTGGEFLRDVAASFLGDFNARDRVTRHMREEEVERGSQFTDRAAGTGAFAGLTIPQYLTELYAPAAKAVRPFADICNNHPMPAQGMTVNLSRITTATSTAVQASENSAVSETNIDDTLLTINVQTIAGQQTLSRQAIERSTGAEDVMLDDLFRSYATTLDSTLINQASTGLTNVATSVAYTDGTPTAAELWPKLLNARSNIEGVLLDTQMDDTLAVMHSRRWHWLQSQVGPNWPFIAQALGPNMSGGQDAGLDYGRGFRGNVAGLNVIVDNNIGTTLGAGTEDEIYVVNRRECHLWEDASAPVMIRAEQTPAASLGVLFVVYGYVAYTFQRYTGGTNKIAGTGLIAPVFA